MQRWGFPKTTMMDLIEGPDTMLRTFWPTFSHMERILIGDEQAERMNQNL
ncbi:hypothetical protein Ocin01_19825 [Orchesella cincta]|uniref:Uncharacterized protein n=1 Tax=Orchesella cincta TaxID=48709 RepID=A0A1D2M1M5_ORCCI|nr:hypothetical protein Ocin01_19825 [Orchesella cincta]